jgi:hypothetical protein
MMGPPGYNGGSTTHSPRVTQCIASDAGLKVFFSKAMKPKPVELVGNYIVEAPLGTTQTAQTATYDPGTNSVLLTGLNLPKGTPVKVTVNNVTDTEGNYMEMNVAQYADVTTWKYFIGFGLPMILATLLSIGWFATRDL